MKTIDVVNKLIGPIQPVGDSNVDEKRLENLRNYIVLAREMIHELKAVEENSKSHMHSVSFAGHTAKVFLDELQEELKI